MAIKTFTLGTDFTSVCQLIPFAAKCCLTMFSLKSVQISNLSFVCAVDSGADTSPLLGPRALHQGPTAAPPPGQAAAPWRQSTETLNVTDCIRSFHTKKQNKKNTFWLSIKSSNIHEQRIWTWKHYFSAYYLQSSCNQCYFPTQSGNKLQDDGRDADSPVAEEWKRGHATLQGGAL